VLGLEPALDGAHAQHLTGAYRFGKAVKRHWPEVTVFEQFADQLTGALGDDQTAHIGRGSQASVRHHSAAGHALDGAERTRDLRRHRPAIARRYRTGSHSAFLRDIVLRHCAHCRSPRCGEPNAQENTMNRHLVRYFPVALLALAAAAITPLPAAADSEDGIVRVRSAYPMAESVARLKKDIADKGIKFFIEIDQAKLAADAGIKLKPSTLLVFGNPPLGTQFITSNPNSGLDWPVRLLVQEDDRGQVWAVYTDFDWIARRHQITDRDAQFKMATSVIGSITSSIAK
jgi:uncharacterized protein (DUF302 family)